MGHAEKITLREVNKPHAEVFYFPMHGVMKDTSSTTRLRIVFDGSVKSSSEAAIIRAQRRIPKSSRTCAQGILCR